MSKRKFHLIKVVFLGLGSAALWVLFAWWFYRSSKEGIGLKMELFCLAVSGFGALLTNHFAREFKNTSLCIKREKEGFSVVFYKKTDEIKEEIE